MALHLFWDNSNIWLVGRGVCSQREPGDEQPFRISFEHLLDFVVNKRQMDTAFVGGSVPPNNDPLWKEFERLGIEVQKQERGEASGKEIAVDDVIQLAMANTILDVDPPGTLVLLTGDGAGYHDGKGFITMLERARKHGWQIEVVSWDAGCNKRLRTYAQHDGTYRALESVYDKVTFINNKRWANPV